MLVSLPIPCFSAEGGAAGAPGASPFTGGGSSRQGRGASSGGADLSPDDLLAELRSELEQTKRNAAQAQQRSAGVEKTMDGLRSVLGGGAQEAEPDWYEDELLPHLFQLEKEGKSHPMIAKLAAQLKKEQEGTRAYAQKFAQLEAQIAQLSDPRAQNDDRAYGQIDDFLTTELEQVYGEAPSTLHRAVAANIAADLTRLQKEFPGKWEEIRRNPQALQKVVKHHILQIVPPQAKQAIAKQVEDATPVTLQTLNQAWNEFQQIKGRLDPHDRERVATELRRQILAERYAQTRRIPGGR